MQFSKCFPLFKILNNCFITLMVINMMSNREVQNIMKTLGLIN